MECIFRILATMTKKETTRRRTPQLRKFKRFAAIDFETADYGRDSACSVAAVVVENGKIIYQGCSLIRPPRPHFVFTHIHGITWEDVAHQPNFGEFWPRLRPVLSGVDFIAAHNASFDRSVLLACCEECGARAPEADFLCTMKLARRLWDIYPTKLPDVCSRLNIPLKHHDAASDALACAKIVMESAEMGVPLSAMLKAS